MDSPVTVRIDQTSSERRLQWQAALTAAGARVIAGAGDEGVDVVLSEAQRPSASTSVGWVEVAAASSGELGAVAPNLLGRFDLRLAADSSPREAALACVLLARIVRLEWQQGAAHEREQRLTGLAFTDPLTGLPNRRAWDERVPAAIAPGNPQPECCVAIIDVDQFKRLNGELGYAAGDACLAEVARRLSQAVRQHDFVARLGGDEFAVLLVGVDASAVGRLVDRVRRTIGDQPFEMAAGRSITASAGWTCECRPAETALQRADQALRAAKAAGRDRTEPREGDAPAEP